MVVWKRVYDGEIEPVSIPGASPRWISLVIAQGGLDAHFPGKRSAVTSLRPCPRPAFSQVPGELFSVFSYTPDMVPVSATNVGSIKVNFDTASIAPKSPIRDSLNRADLESSSAHSFPGPAYKRPGPSASARDVHRMFWEHDGARVWGQAETAGPRWEPALGHVWSGDHR